MGLADFSVGCGEGAFGSSFYWWLSCRSDLALLLAEFPILGRASSNPCKVIVWSHRMLAFIKADGALESHLDKFKFSPVEYDST